ncbi:hypothetical protein ETAA8_31860 [Anatilimnocola aggregata]|uniref:Uncharacterized protein n=1 Tax=Anatilimnocola aggregata TaxID=2528021 RepID=A0A517YCX6_9BACT|nr:hypothetical protein [Anatilimnocola aggregata]QDU28093.1 hypothetical protein ETAA8_31860 [Anatilimnocola aggregata]
MKTFSILGLAACAALAFAPMSDAQAGGRRCCCGNTVYAAPAAASPAAAATSAPAATVAQNQGYRSFSYQPGAAAPANYYNRGSSYRRSNQPMWMNGGNKSLGRYN